MPKTGTKLLQTELFAEHSEIHFLGTYIQVPEKRPFRQCRSGNVLELMDNLIWDRKFHPDWSRCRELYEKTIGQPLSDGLVPVWSWESLMEDRHSVQRVRAENMKSVLGDCKLIVTLRHPLKLVESLYLQILKRDNVGSRLSARRGLVYSPINRWLKKNWKNEGFAPNTHLEYADAIRIFADVFGKDSVKIMLYEDLVKNQHSYISAICRYIGVNENEGVSLSDGKRANERWSQDQFDRLSRLKKSPVQRTLFRFAGRKERREMLGLPPKGQASIGEPARLDTSDQWKQRICDKTKEGNRWLMSQWDLPLEQHGYPV